MKKNAENTSRKPRIHAARKFIIAGAAVVAAAAAAAVLCEILRKPSVSFYNIDARTQAAITKQIQQIQNGNRKKEFRTVTLDSSVPLSAQKKIWRKTGIIFAALDYDCEAMFRSDRKISGLPASVLGGMPTTTVNSVPSSGGTVPFVPLLYDFYQVDVNYPVFVSSRIDNINVWDDFISFAEKSKLRVSVPLVFPGRNHSEFLNIFGMITEATSGYRALAEIQSQLYNAFTEDKKNRNQSENTAVTEKVYEFAEKNTAFRKTAGIIRFMRKEKLVPENIRDFPLTDMKFFMDQNLPAAAFIKLSEHRSMDRSALENFKSVYCPGTELTAARKFPAAMICAAAVKKDKRTAEIIRQLASSGQTALALESGLAPVQKNCRIPDKQADDVRYWLAASDGPQMYLSAALPSAEARSAAWRAVWKIINSYDADLPY